MPLTPQQHLDNLVRHIDLVRGACLLLGERLMSQGRQEFGRILIARGFEHDVSKFSGIEWDYLHAGRDVPKEQLDLAVRQHVRTNTHHPEYWGGIENMPEIAVAEMVCDWYARGQEFGTSLRDWINTQATDRFKIDRKEEYSRWIDKYVGLLLEDHFVR
jgi:hypothetical protein